MIESVRIKTRREHRFRAQSLIPLRTTVLTAASGGDGRTAAASNCEDAIRDVEVVKPVGMLLDQDGSEHAWAEGRDVIDRDIMNGRSAREHHQEDTAALVLFAVDVIGDDVVNAVDSTIGSEPVSLTRRRVRDLENSSHIANPVVAQSDVIDAADWAHT